MLPFGQNCHGPKIWGLRPLLRQPSWVPIYNNVARAKAKAYLLAKSHLDPFNRLAAIGLHQGRRQTGQTGQIDNGLIT